MQAKRIIRTLVGKDSDLFVVPGEKTFAKKEESTFRKWFYEHRGDNNRAWKKKRREAKKVQRQRENRRATRRVV